LSARGIHHRVHARLIEDLVDGELTHNEYYIEYEAGRKQEISLYTDEILENGLQVVLHDFLVVHFEHYNEHVVF
jgi:hypothetical protein